MKKILIVLIAAISFSAGNSTQAQVTPGISFNTFYNELSPYGRWINYPEYGQVWITNQVGFEPYYDNGQWEFTSYGWTWVSDYPWGWAPFHYGRWAFTSYGWVWVPGYQWAPAWVSWCQNDGYYGWAPLSPGMGFNISFNGIPGNRWRFVQHQYISSPQVHSHIIRPVRNANIYNKVTMINNTQAINNITYGAGPKREEVERVTRRKIETKQIVFIETVPNTQAGKSELKIYRPDSKASGGTENNKPATKEENVQAVPLQNPIQKDAIVKPMQPAWPVLTDQQKLQQGADRRRLQEERAQQVQRDQPMRQQPLPQVEIEKQHPVIQPNTEREEPVKPPKIQQQQELIKQQQLQDQKNQQQAAQLQDQQRQLELQEQELIRKQRQIRQQQTANQKNEQQQEAERQRLERQNEIRQQRIEQQQNQPPQNPPRLQQEQKKPEQKERSKIPI